MTPLTKEALETYRASALLGSGGSPGVLTGADEAVIELCAEVERLTQLVPDDVSTDECSVAIHAIRMIRLGYSYDAASGIWWHKDDKPGVLAQAEAALAAMTAERDRLQQQIVATAWVRAADPVEP